MLFCDFLISEKVQNENALKPHKNGVFRHMKKRCYASQRKAESVDTYKIKLYTSKKIAESNKVISTDITSIIRLQTSERGLNTAVIYIENYAFIFVDVPSSQYKFNGEQARFVICFESKEDIKSVLKAYKKNKEIIIDFQTYTNCRFKRIHKTNMMWCKAVKMQEKRHPMYPEYFEEEIPF